jgi:hypothetical protein
VLGPLPATPRGRRRRSAGDAAPRRSGSTAGRGAMALFLAVAALWALVGGERPAAAQDKKTVIVLEIQGAPPKLQAALEKALRNKYTVIPVAKWNAAAKKLNVTGQGTDEVALVAAEVKVDAVVTGKVKGDKDVGSYKLNIAARHGATGKPLGKLTYELKSPKVDNATIAQAEGDIEKAVDEAIAGPPPEAPTPPVAAATPPEPESPSMLGREDNPLEKMKKMEEDAKREREHVARPVYYPFIDAGAAFIVNGRSFNYAEEAGTSAVKCYDFTQKADPNSNMMYVYRYSSALKSCPKYAPSLSTGVRADVTAYPLAFVRFNGLRGLGIGATFDWMFWPSSMTSTTPPRALDTREFRLEFGLRYHWNIMNKRNLPSIMANVQYGLHYFAVAKEDKTYTYQNDFGLNVTAQGVDDHGLPDILYQYITLGVGGRVPYYATDRMFFGLLVNFNFHIMLNYGEIATTFADNSSAMSVFGPGGYGPASGYGFRVGFTPLEMIPWKGLTIRVSGYYEMFNTSFALGSGSTSGTALPPVDRTVDNAARHIAQGATDQYFGGLLQVGYQY